MDPNIFLADPRIQALLTQLRGVPATFNAARERQALTAARGLADAGYFENVGTNQVTADSGIEGAVPNVTYTLAMGPQGRLYRQAFMDTTNAFAARGNLQGSDRRRADQQGKAQLDSNVNRTTFELGNSMSSSLADQGERISGINADIGGLKFEIGQAEAERKARADEAAAAAPPAPGQNPRASGRIWTGSHAPNRRTLAQRWGVPIGNVVISAGPHPGYRAWYSAPGTPNPTF